MAFCSLPFWHSWASGEKARTRRTGGSWVWGPRGAWCDIRPCFICSESLLALLRAVLGKASSGAMAGREKGGKGGGRWGRGGERAKGIPPASQGTGSPKQVQGFKRGEWPDQFADEAIYYPQAAGFSVCPVSLGGGSPGWGKARAGCSLGCIGLCMCPSRMLGAWLGGALEPWPAKWVLSQPPRPEFTF